MLLLVPVLLAVSCKNSSYSVEDFRSVKKIDTHIHLNTDQTSFIEQAAADNLQFLDIVDDRPFGIPMKDQEVIANKQIKAFPQRVKYAATFSVSEFDHAGWQAAAIDHLKSEMQKGAIAVKVWKNIGMALKDTTGKFVMIDHHAFDTIISYLENNHVPLIGHLGEPRECWLPLDQMVLHKGYYSEHPEYHMFLHPEYPSYEMQVESRDNVLAKHPNLVFVGAHLGSLEWSLDELAKRLDRFPNMSVDLARMSDIYFHTEKNWQKTYDFFIKYQDRLLYATDIQVRATDDPKKMNQNTHDARVRLWKFFVSDDAFEEEGIGSFKGLHLPRSVVDKIYFGNAKRIFPQF